MEKFDYHRNSTRMGVDFGNSQLRDIITVLQNDELIENVRLLKKFYREIPFYHRYRARNP